MMGAGMVGGTVMVSGAGMVGAALTGLPLSAVAPATAAAGVDVVATAVAVVATLVVVAVVVASVAVVRAARQLRSAAAGLAEAATRLEAEARTTRLVADGTLAHAHQELARVDDLIGSAEQLTETVSSASRLAYAAAATPVIKVMALSRGTSHASRRLRQGRRRR